MANTVAAAELLHWRRTQLAAGGQPSQLDWLLDLEGGVRWQTLQQLRLYPDRPVSLAAPLTRLAELWQEHLQQGTPLQYLVGRCPWRDLELEVAPGALIPRQETELLIDLTAELIPPTDPARDGSNPGLWADLGTGSGCLALALARAWPGSKGIAVDQSPQALALAERNIKVHQLEGAVELRQGSWWEPLADCAGTLALVVSNPPYIPTAVWAQLEAGVRDHEPSLALDGGADGLDAIRRIAAGAIRHLAPGGWLLLEHHHDQSSAVLALLRAAGLEQVQAHRDLEGVWRFASGQRPSATP
ncbi:MAG: peptide chain release factor N(5)-glutamine methyltransferase [Vulcanococcus sp.]|uniref:peptide chain release factor N(5)-glutamine methyltransferase n=1 Tax=Vulcanococcus sp. TaxID=2856995 RepID=UPI0025CD081E|nr:peptide chain release factor N(5)-glutamine methyltransferase [Vulcanococcus sp.]MBW0168403.1 peptide chain release factor N(5)-glutamine methyltransferase [Vulcanococcus sp.]